MEHVVKFLVTAIVLFLCVLIMNVTAAAFFKIIEIMTLKYFMILMIFVCALIAVLLSGRGNPK